MLGKLDKEKLQYLTACLEDLNFGSVVITVHNGEITQIDTTEKRRFQQLAKRKN